MIDEQIKTKLILNDMNVGTDPDLEEKNNILRREGTSCWFTWSISIMNPGNFGTPDAGRAAYQLINLILFHISECPDYQYLIGETETQLMSFAYKNEDSIKSDKPLQIRLWALNPWREWIDNRLNNEVCDLVTEAMIGMWFKMGYPGYRMGQFHTQIDGSGDIWLTIPNDNLKLCYMNCPSGQPRSNQSYLLCSEGLDYHWQALVFYAAIGYLWWLAEKPGPI